MARGRPKSTNPRPKSRMVRLDPDLAFMLAEIYRQTRVTAPEIIGPLIRPVIMTQFHMLLPALRQMAEASEEVRARLEEYDRIKVEIGPDYRPKKKPKKRKSTPPSTSQGKGES